MLARLARTEPVRLYGIATAGVGVVAYFVPSGAWPLVLVLVGAVLGVGEQVRGQVWSRAGHEAAVDEAMGGDGNLLPEPDEVPTTGSPESGAVTLAEVCLVIIAIVAVLYAFGEVPR